MGVFVKRRDVEKREINNIEIISQNHKPKSQVGV
ncbi:MAG: hypothetical protein ACJAZX_000387 [Rickettsiales bacterium]|jgi:hypothetical protein